MATLYVAEFPHSDAEYGSRTQAARVPPITEQAMVFGASSSASSAFTSQTKLVRLHTDAICSVAFGTSPTAAATNARLAANQTEYFAVNEGSAMKVAVITNT